MMQEKRWANLSQSFAVLLLFLGGCSHAGVNNGGGGGNHTATVILAFHDTPPAGIAVTSFEVTVTGAVLQPGNVSLLSAPGQKIELTQLQSNLAFLSTTQVAPASYTSLTITYANPMYTILNDSGVQTTVNGQTCAMGASCVVTPTVTTSTIKLSGSPFPVLTTTGQTTFLRVDVNLNDIIQPDFSVDFSKSAAITLAQSTSDSATPIGSLSVAGSVTSIGSNQFVLAASSGQSLTVAVNSSTAFQFARANCTANNFTCLSVGQIVTANLNILPSGTLQASEIDFDDAATTQQVAGTIVSFNGTPPTSFQMIMHNTVPSISNFFVGTPVTVNIANNAAFVVNNGSLTLPVGVTFATTSDLLVGQEVEARVSGAFTSGQSPSFTTDRIALEPSQITATITSVNAGNSSFVLNNLSPLFTQNPSGTIIQIQAFTASETQFQTAPAGTFTDLTNAAPPNNLFSVGGFLFNTSGASGSPTMAALTVVGPILGP